MPTIMTANPPPPAQIGDQLLETPTLTISPLLLPGPYNQTNTWTRPTRSTLVPRDTVGPWRPSWPGNTPFFFLRCSMANSPPSRPFSTFPPAAPPPLGRRSSGRAGAAPRRPSRAVPVYSRLGLEFIWGEKPRAHCTPVLVSSTPPAAPPAHRVIRPSRRPWVGGVLILIYPMFA